MRGCEGLFPLDADLCGAPIAHRIFAACVAMLSTADAIVADLSSFRGPHIDDGTAFELGFATALGIPIFGYATDLRPLVKRISALTTGEKVDAQGLDIEDFGHRRTRRV